MGVSMYISEGEQMTAYDLLIKGCRVIDPAQGMDALCDIAVSGGEIAAVRENIDPDRAKKVIDATGLIATPGLIDFHCHVYDVIPLGARPDQAGIRQAVTTVVEGGSAGAAIFAGLPRYVIPRARSTVYCYLNISVMGLSRIPEFSGWPEIDMDACRATIEANRGLIRGLKMRLVGDLIAEHGREVLKMAKELSRETGLPLMVHIGDTEKKVPPKLSSVCLDMLERGDILLHIYTPQQGKLLNEDGSLVPGLREAMERGVLLDAAPGLFNISYEIAQKMMEQGVLPDIISSDFTSLSLPGPVYGLGVTMSRYMTLGLSLAQVVEMTTAAPARALGLAGCTGALKPGMDADISVMELRAGQWKIPDTAGKDLTLSSLLFPAFCVKSGKVINANPAAWPDMKCQE